MFNSAIIQAVRDRLAVNGPSLKLYDPPGTGLLSSLQTVALVAGVNARPYGVINLSSQFIGSLLKGRWDINVIVTLYGDHQSQMSTLWTAADLVVGDAYADGNNGVPTYGLHNHNLGTITVNGYTVKVPQLIHRTTESGAIDETVATVTLTFETSINVGG